VALATFPYLLASGTMRLAGDRTVARFGPVAVLRVGALVACAGLAVVVFAPTWPVAVLGFLVMGAGVAVVAPLSFSAAARLAGGDTSDDGERRARVDAVIARFNQFNYVGALLGAVMTGVVGAGSLRIGFAVPMVLVLGLLPLATAFDPARRLAD
jgi:MFS family permease